jgi:hypothetical protein
VFWVFTYGTICEIRFLILSWHQVVKCWLSCNDLQSKFTEITAHCRHHMTAAGTTWHCRHNMNTAGIYKTYLLMLQQACEHYYFISKCIYVLISSFFIIFLYTSLSQYENLPKKNQGKILINVWVLLNTFLSCRLLLRKTFFWW